MAQLKSTGNFLIATDLRMKPIFCPLLALVLAAQCRADDTNHAVIGRPATTLSQATAFKSKLVLVFTDDFNRADGTNLGTAWT
ncbi:MAG TPA: hypothetical protein VFV81_09530, partial [Verrucomicrobiae bacterium]|nr:hypothetical protein [Verrucomicrobiae bacterium]